MKLRFAGMALCALSLLVGCADDTDSIGIPSDADVVVSDVKTYNFTTRSVKLGAVTANSSKSYFGRVHDAASDIDVTADFLAQFHVLEDYTLPSADKLVKDAEGKVVCDGVELRMYFNTYKGDGNTPLKVELYELDKDNVLSEAETYYTDQDLSVFINPQRTTPVVAKTFTAEDQTVDPSERAAEGYYKNILLTLPVEDGQRILQAAVDHPEYFKDSYQLIHNVLPGYYFKYKGGNGAMLAIDVCVLNVHFHYYDKDGGLVDGLARFSSTQEVIQSTRIENKGIDELMSYANDGDGNPTQAFTFLTSPAGIATEVLLPVDEIYEGHDNDSISRARIVLTRMNDGASGSAFGTPTSLLMVRRTAYDSFFSHRQVADGATAYISNFDAGANTFTFENINYLLSYLYHTKKEVMAQEGLTSEAYNAANPYWNRVWLVPVVTAVNSSNVVTSVQHDFSLCSARLVGGTKPLSMQVIYSMYTK